MIHVTTHFEERTRERVSPDADPRELATAIEAAMCAGRTDIVQYLGRQSKDGLRRAMFCHCGGQEFVAVFKTIDTGLLFITVHRAERVE